MVTVSVREYKHDRNAFRNGDTVRFSVPKHWRHTALPSGDIPGFKNSVSSEMVRLLYKLLVESSYTVADCAAQGVYLEEESYGWPSCFFVKE